MRWLAGLVVGVALLSPSGQAQPLTKAQADGFQAKLSRIVSFGNAARRDTRARQTVQVTDAEVNAYLRYHAQDHIPAGIVDPMLFAHGDGMVSGQAIVDLDAVRSQKPRGWLDPMGYLTGRLPLTARGRLVAENGVGRFYLESATVSGVAIPKTVLQELLSYYSRTPEDPDGINMDDPFQLPSHIREIRVARGAATIVQ